MDFNFRNPQALTNDRLRGRQLTRDEEEALKEQRHRQALALLEVARQQQNTPLAAGGPVSPFGRSPGGQQIEDPGTAGIGAAAANALGLDTGKISNAGFAGLQRNAPSGAGANNNQALNLPFGGGAVAASARGPEQRGIGDAQPTPNQPVNAAFSSSDRKAELLDFLGIALLEENINPRVGSSVLIADGSTRIVAAGGGKPKCDGDGEIGGCSVSYDPDQQFPGIVAIQERDENGKWQFMDDERIVSPPKGGSAFCQASRNNPRGFCQEIPAFVVEKDV